MPSMKNIWVLILIAVSSAYAYDEPVNCPEGWNIPQLDGSWKCMSPEEFESLVRELEPQPRSTLSGIYLYTNNNPEMPQELALGDVGSVRLSYFDGNLPTRVLIHGYNRKHNDELYPELRSTFLAIGKYNLITVEYTSDISYPLTVLGLPEIGRKLAEFLDFLNTEAGMAFETLMLVGHSLGAQIAGFIGKNVRNGRIPQIIALDPAMPIYSALPPSQRLNSSDAFYVESIQTNGGFFGFLEPIGTATFYPNGGSSQPGCGLDIICSHLRSYKFYAEALRLNDFPCIGCNNELLAHLHECGRHYSSVKMGAPTNMEDGIKGVFYVPVNAESPYGKGE